MLSALGETAFESDCAGLMAGLLVKVTFCISQNSLGYAVGTNKPNSQCLTSTNVPFSHRLHVQNVLVAKLMYFHDPDAAMGREWLILHLHIGQNKFQKGGYEVQYCLYPEGKENWKICE